MSHYLVSGTATPGSVFGILSAGPILQNFIEVLFVVLLVSLISAIATATFSWLMFPTAEETASESNKMLSFENPVPNDLATTESRLLIKNSEISRLTNDDRIAEHGEG
jgi:hypothetical protein